MKYATLLLGLAIVLASIAAAQAEMLNCDGILVERVYTPTCPASVSLADCRTYRLHGFTVSQLPWRRHVRIDFRLDTKTNKATLNGKRCEVPE
jgi:hypothetical protein